jgi:hypothetical protein
MLAEMCGRLGPDAVMGLSCDRWGCPTCSQRLKAQWQKNILSRFKGLRESGVKAVSVFAGDEGEWDAVRKRLARQKAGYVCVEFDGAILVVADRLFEGAERVPLEQGWNRFVQALTAIKPDGLEEGPDGKHHEVTHTRRVSTSRNWQLHKDEEKKYKDAGPVYTGLKGYAEVAKKHGATVREWVFDEDNPPPGNVIEAEDVTYGLKADAKGRRKRDDIRHEASGRVGRWTPKRRNREPGPSGGKKGGEGR